MNFRRLLVTSFSLLLVVLTPAHCQIRAGCTASSMSSQRASSFSALEIGRWECYAMNLNGQEPATLTPAGFALDFLELRQIDPIQVVEIFTVKQKRTGKAIAVEILSYALLGVTYVTSTGVLAMTTKQAASLGVGATGAHLYSDKLAGEIPSTVPAIGTQLTQPITLPPGGTYHWTTFASKMRNADHVGPKILTMPGTEPGIPIPIPPAPKPPNAKANPIPWIRQQMLCG